ncbi:hypothetical protein [Zwartia vadi]|uniref:hypothetical protein n=1 Tax=Zwartia vadi TaxID=3058168 RepID=UPI0025B3A4B4|nr:hypothetical protein [Zwartia vadi]MDN3986532.1 hypothetical protein [Zwartia vadi]
MKKIFQKFILLSFVSVSSIVGSAWANGLTIAQYNEWNRDPIKKEMLNTYTAGMGQGVVFSNIYNKTQKIPMIFCPPNNLQLTGDLTNSILAKFIAKNNFKLTDEISIILIFAMKDAYPC